MISRSRFAIVFAAAMSIVCGIVSARAVGGEAHDIPSALNIHARDARIARIELTPFAGDFLGDTLEHTFLVGSHLDVRLNPTFSLGTDFGWSLIEYDPQSAFGQTVVDDQLYSLQGTLSFNIPAAYLSRNSIVESDFFTSVGGGMLRINRSNRGDGFIGGGLKVYLKKVRWLGIRVEVRNFFRR